MLLQYLLIPALFVFLTENVGSADIELQFNGTLEGAGNCEPESDAFCGAYTGVIRIDPEQPGYELNPFTQDYTGDVVIRFADGRTASCRARQDLKPDLAMGEYREFRTRFCLISVSKSKDAIRIQTSFNPIEEGITSIALVYVYDAKTFDIKVLSQVVAGLLQPPVSKSFWVTGHACWWGPCIDKSVSRLSLAEDATGSRQQR